LGVLRQIKHLTDEVKPVFAVVESFSTAIENGTFDYEEPRTELKRLIDRLGHAFAQVDVSKIRPLAEPLFVALMRMLARPTVIARIRDAFREDGYQTLDRAASVLTPGEPEPVEENPKVQACLAYLEGLHHQLPYATMAIIANLPIWNPRFLWDVFDLVHLMRRARNTTGEKRARALKELARHVTENIHQRYVQGVEFAERLSQGRNLPKRESSYGVAINALVKEWGSPAVRRLIHPDAATLRNAASHMDRWHEDVEAELIVIHDANNPAHKLRYTFDEMYDYCERLAEEASAFAEAILTHGLKLFGGLVVETQLLELALAEFSQQPLSPDAAEKEKQEIGKRFDPLKERLAAMKPKEKLVRG
jgi:hypothetical protein